MLSIALLPAVQAVHAPDGAAFVVALASDLGIGAAIGVAASVLYDGAYAGGRALDDYVGIRGSVPNAQIFAGAGFGRIWSLVFTAGFFLLGGYRIVIFAFCRSFQSVPPGGAISAHRTLRIRSHAANKHYRSGAARGRSCNCAGIRCAAHVGALTRVIPRFASFTLSFPIIFALALVATIAAVPLLFGKAPCRGCAFRSCDRWPKKNHLNRHSRAWSARNAKAMSRDCRSR